MEVERMGTSKRNLSNEIKKLLKGQPLSNINETAPGVTKKILTNKVLSENFDQEETINNSIRIITNQFNSLESNGFKGKTRKELVTDPISQQEFLELILEQIESDTLIQSKILEKALKIVMCKLLEIDEYDVYSFAQILFYEIVYQILLGELNDNIKDIYEEIEYELIQNMVRNVSNEIMNDTVYTKVNLFIDRKISLSQVLGEIANQTSRASFGDF
jgi:predicted hydrolase (HD superfamily)